MPGGDPLPPPRHWLPGADRRRLRLVDPVQHSPRSRQERPGPPQEGGRDGDHPAAAAGADPNDLRGLGIARSSWSASPVRSDARSWRRSASSSWRRPTATSGSPCRRPKASRPTPSASPCPKAIPIVSRPHAGAVAVSCRVGRLRNAAGSQRRKRSALKGSSRRGQKRLQLWYQPTIQPKC